MKCSKCNSNDDHVIDSRVSEDGGVIRRRRECKSCSHRYTTYERIEKSTPLKVLKRRGKIRENFDPSKLRGSIDVVCHKLKISPVTIENITEEIILEIRQKFDREVTYKEISMLVMEKLEKENQIAFLRYASAYEDFISSKVIDPLYPLLPEDPEEPDDDEPANMKLIEEPEEEISPLKEVPLIERSSPLPGSHDHTIQERSLNSENENAKGLGKEK